MKVLTLFGTRPEIIRLSSVIPVLDRHAEQILVHTGQNFDPALSDVFLQEFGLRPPDVSLGIRAEGFAVQVAGLIAGLGPLLEQHRPDRLLVLGDTNSALGALVAARMGIPVFHMEAGNRSYDDRVPEEVNRRIVDHCSSILMPYTGRSAANLVREGIDRDRIFVIGNPIFEVLQKAEPQIQASGILHRMKVAAGRFFLATLHRAENVDDPERLRGFLEGLAAVAATHGLPVLLALHPRTASRITSAPDPALVRITPPLGFFDFVRLEKEARLVLSDSGTVQEECAILGVPSICLRDVTERPETLECGSSMLTGGDPSEIVRVVTTVMDLQAEWTVPPEYLVPHVSSTVARIVLGSLSVRRHGP